MAAREGQVARAPETLGPVPVRRLGQLDYEPVWRAMQRFTDARDERTQDEIWLVEHPPVFTLGQAGREEHVLAPGDIPVLNVDRGGQVTYHGPGQIVLYPLVDLRRAGLGIKALVELLEQAVIDTLATWGIDAARLTGAPGVYVDGAKVAALGLRVRRGCTFHGLACNVAMDLEPFQRINPCGFQGLAVTEVSALGGPANLDVVGTALATAVAAGLGRSLAEGESQLPESADE
ncbi:MAG: lipoyl(octanoyl) transferase LipB [Pseudomonadota bacterium]